MELYTKKEAQELGITGFTGLGFVNPTTAFKKINKKILELIKAGDLVFRKPWRDGYRVKGVTYGPQNYETQHPYSGFNAWLINFMNLNLKENNMFFLTAKQIKERGGKLKKDAVEYPVHAFIKGEKVSTNKKTGKEESEEYVGWMDYVVYPIGHTEGIKPIVRKNKKETPEQFIPDADVIIKHMPKVPEIKTGGDSAHYVPSKDFVQMPAKKAFKDINKYYSVLFHELIHSTGHKNRVGRDLTNRSPSKGYAFEELIAELGAAYLCGVTEIDYYTVNNSAAYLKSWSKALAKEIEEDHSFLLRAVYASAKAAKYIIGNTLEKESQMSAETNHLDKNGAQSEGGEILKAIYTVQASKLKGGFMPYFQSEHTYYLHEITEGKLKYFIESKSRYGDVGSAFYGYDSSMDYKGVANSISAKLKCKTIRLYKEDFNGTQPVSVHGKPKDVKQMSLFGTEDKGIYFIGVYVKLHNVIVSQVDAIRMYQELNDAITSGEININKHPFAKDIKQVRSSLNTLCEYTRKYGPTQVIIMNMKRYKEILNHGLNGLSGLTTMIPFVAAVGGKLIEMAIEKHFGHHEAVGSTKRTNKDENRTKETPKRNNSGLSGVDVPGFVRADQQPEQKAADVFRLPGEMGKFFQDIQKYKGMIVVTGDPHAGKTEFTFQLINAFAEHGDKVGCFSVEQGGMESKDTKGAVDRNIQQKNKANVSITGDAPKGLQTIKEMAKHFDVIVVDSWQKLNAPSTMLDSLRHEFPDKFFIVIFQQNGEGGTRGGVAADYDTPIYVKVHKVDTTFKNNFAELIKNRGNQLNVKYMIKAKKTLPLFTEDKKETKK
jgi:antirestriction protein ArdC